MLPLMIVERRKMLKPILLVEDDKRDLELTLIALERSQLANDVIVLRDGAMALDYLRREGEYADRAEGNPAVILLDLKLPKVTGLEVLQAVRADSGLRSIPVVMLTSSQEESDVLRSYEFGVNAYVVKPVAFDQFVSAIAELGIFWAVLNEPPPGSLKAARRNE
jgi:CheY-like chemotaxis protein